MAKPKRPYNASQAQLKKLLIPMVLVTILGFVLGSAPLLILGGVVWFFWLAYYILIGGVLMPTGASTPPPKWHSQIEAMVASGQYEKAAEAFKAEIETDPEDVGACEKLGQLALREIKDFKLALWAYREAENRAQEPKRKLGYALMITGILRDYLQDGPKTMVELRRLLAQYPDAPNAAQMRAEIREIKTALAEPTEEP